MLPVSDDDQHLTDEALRATFSAIRDRGALDGRATGGTAQPR